MVDEENRPARSLQPLQLHRAIQFGANFLIESNHRYFRLLQKLRDQAVQPVLMARPIPEPSSPWKYS